MTPKSTAAPVWSILTRPKNCCGCVATSFHVSKKEEKKPRRARSANGDGASAPPKAPGGG
jgi:hypothetical protein